MALGKRKREEQDLWVATADLPKSPGHPFYRQLNGLLAEVKFDEYVERLCEPHYAKHMGRPGIPPGVYFRMLFVGYFEGLSSQRAIAWRCSDSRSLQGFLGLPITESTPDHSSLSIIRHRLPAEVHEQVFIKVLQIAQDKKLLKGKTVAVDSTFIEADAAMKSIVRKDTGDDYKEYLKKLAIEAGMENPTDEELHKFDQGRKDKKVSNEEWESTTDHDSRIAKMKDGRTHMAYKTEHAVDLESDLIVAATVHHADQGDTTTLTQTIATAQTNLVEAGSEEEIKDAVADKGYHSNDNVTWCEGYEIRTYIPERASRHERVWTDKPAAQKKAVYGNRRRVRGNRGKQLGRLRSEYIERSFAHVCETGGARRSHLRGLMNVTKRYLMYVAAKNLGVLMRAFFNMGTPRGLQGSGKGLPCAILAWYGALRRAFQWFWRRPSFEAVPAPTITGQLPIRAAA